MACCNRRSASRGHSVTCSSVDSCHSSQRDYGQSGSICIHHSPRTFAPSDCEQEASFVIDPIHSNSIGNSQFTVPPTYDEACSVPKQSDEDLDKIKLEAEKDGPNLENYFEKRIGYYNYHKENNRPKTTNNVYMVVIAACDMPSSGTCANLFIRINGTRGRLENTWLKNPVTERKIANDGKQDAVAFTPRSITRFKIYAPDLGHLKSITLGHDSVEKNDSWFVKYVEITKMQNRLTWHFVCNNWLSSQHGDGRIVRELFLNNPRCTDYEILVSTGNCETTANVYITLFGVKGKTDRIHLENWKKLCFKCGQTDKFVVSDFNVGEIFKIKVEHDNSGFQPKWFLEKIVITNLNEQSKPYHFACGAWFSVSEEDQYISREFTPSKYSSNDQDVHRYKIVVYTGRQPCADIDADIWIQLLGNDGVSDCHHLGRPGFGSFKRGVLTFFTSIPFLGNLNKVKFQDCITSLQPPWYLVKVSVEDLETNKTFIFPASKWLGGGDPIGQLGFELHLGRVSNRSDNSELKHQLPPSLPKRAESVFRVHTSDIPFAGTDAHVFLQLYGTRGISKTLAIEGAGLAFEAGHIEEVHAFPGNVGMPYKMRIWHDNTGSSPSWHLNKIEWFVAGQYYKFSCKRWLSKIQDDHEIVRELPAIGTDISNPMTVLKYKVTIFTGNRQYAETDAKVFCRLNGERGDTGDRQLVNSTRRESKPFERGQTDEFIIEAVDLIKIKSVFIGHDNSGVGPGWFLEKVTVYEISGQHGHEQLFPCDRWLARDEDDGEISRELFEQFEASSPKLKVPSSKKVTSLPPKPSGPFFRLYTSNIDNASTDAQVFIQLYGDEGKSKIVQCQGAGKKFEAGHVDEVYISLNHIGTPYKMRIWHDNTGYSPGWHLNKVEWVVGQETFVFPCGRWLSTTNDDGLVLRELPASGPGIRTPLQILKYKVFVVTGDKPAAGTDAKVFCCLYGERGDTGNRHLGASLVPSGIKFRKNSTVECIIEAVDLKKITCVRIFHDNSGLEPA